MNIGGDLVVRGDWTEPVQVANPIADAENGTPLATRRHCQPRRRDERRLPPRRRHRRPSLLAHRRSAHGAAGGAHPERDGDPRRMRSRPGRWPTAFCVLSPQESRAIAAAIPGVEFMLVERDGGTVASAAWAHARGSRRTARAPGRDAGGVRGGTGRLGSRVRAGGEHRARALRRVRRPPACTSRSGSKTRIGSRCARWRSGSRSRAGSPI